MRKIEQLMIQAILNQQDMTKDNTTVTYNSTSHVSVICLHGHVIAEWWHGKARPLAVNTRTLEQWPTNTTKSRLRALGANVTTRKGITYLNNQPIN